MLKQSHWSLRSQHRKMCCSLTQILQGSSSQHEQGVLLKTLSGHADVLPKQLHGELSWAAYHRCFTTGRSCTQQIANIAQGNVLHVEADYPQGST